MDFYNNYIRIYSDKGLFDMRELSLITSKYETYFLNENAIIIGCDDTFPIIDFIYSLSYVYKDRYLALYVARICDYYILPVYNCECIRYMNGKILSEICDVDYIELGLFEKIYDPIKVFIPIED